MRLHCLQHVSFENLAAIDTWAAGRGWERSTTHLYAGERLPALDDLDWLVIMGGPMNIYAEEGHPWLVAEKRLIAQAVAAGKTVLGICLGAQLLADHLGVRVVRGSHPEIGWFPVVKHREADRTAVGRALPPRFTAFHWHGDTFSLPHGCVPLGYSEACPCQGFVFQERVVALQFHLEFTAQRAAAVIDHCGAELIGGPYVQSAEEMLADSGRFERLNTRMAALLDALADGT
ncbi:MAG: type 1 glutamine amidotransferase [Desulfosarcinaceae bacterium]|nr:type 1 glutamine amidotransferase [Desulfosarcinaceae bacterium]